ncbi:MAG: ZIP family metal transporter [Planctomycetaceae bacterium]
MDTSYLVYAVLTFLSSLLGGNVINKLRFSHTGLQLLLSFVGGLMLAVAILHLFPHSVSDLHGDTEQAAYAVLIGIFVTFLLLRTFHVHQHGSHDDAHARDHNCQHPEHMYATTSEAPNHCEVHRSRYSWTGLFVGLGIESIIDGVAISAIVLEATSNLSDHPFLPGFPLAAAILLHKPLDAMSLISVMKSSGWDKKTIGLLNFAFACITPIGIYMAGYGSNMFAGSSNADILGWTLGVSAGCFLTIALSDILPELKFHSHDRFKLTIALVAGIVLGIALQAVEPEHGHSHDHHHDHSTKNANVLTLTRVPKCEEADGFPPSL